MSYPILSCTNCTHDFSWNIIFENISLSIAGQKKVWLVGKNGVWKTTLFSILSKKRKPTAGHITVKGTIGFVPQEVEYGSTVTVKSYLRNFVEGREQYKIDDVLEKVALSWIDQNSLIANLSWGQQKKIAFAKILLEECDILLLDEPTNHLDLEATQRLTEFITRFKGIVFMISHDRALLNECCEQIIELTPSEAEIYDGNYEDYKDEKLQRIEKKNSDYVEFMKRKQKQEQLIHTIRQRASATFSPMRWRLLRSRVKMFERNFEKDSSKIKTKPTFEKKVDLTMGGGHHHGKVILSFKNCTVHKPWSQDILINGFSNEIRGHDRIIFSGANGSGKSTLLKRIVAAYTNPDSEISYGNNITMSYFDQKNQWLDGKKKLIDEFLSSQKPENRNEYFAKTALASIWFKTDHRNVPVESLSYGQRVKLKFLQLIQTNCDLLILDEPTNHLDIDTRESIEHMLQNYEWAILLVSHDTYFVSEIGVNRLWEVKEGRVWEE